MKEIGFSAGVLAGCLQVFCAGVFAAPSPLNPNVYPTEPDHPNCDLIPFSSPVSDAPRLGFIPENVLLEGDIEGIIAPGDDIAVIAQKLDALSRNGVAEDKRWDGGRIPYAISDDFSDSDKLKIMKAICEYDQKTDAVRFVPRKSVTQTEYVFIDTKASGCSATVGKKGSGIQYVHLGPSCSLGSTMHELMHAAGFWHEQTRLDRDDFIEINWSNIQKGKEHNFNRRDTSSTFGFPYDFASQMHYSGKAFAKDPKVWTMRPRSPNHLAAIGLRNGPSAIDLGKLNAMYPLCAKGYGEVTAIGTKWTFTDRSMNNLEPVGLIRSVTVQAGCILTICKDRDFRGGCLDIAGAAAVGVELVSHSILDEVWDKAASSYYCSCEKI